MKNSLKFLRDDGLLMLHDSNNKDYKEGIKLFKVIEERDNTILLAKK